MQITVSKLSFIIVNLIKNDPTTFQLSASRRGRIAGGLVMSVV